MTAEPIRTILLREVGNFVRRTRDMPGVHRIALLGSLTTEKRRPKDADVLVTVGEEADLKVLAAVARKLKGAGQSRASGADVFLCNTSGEYVGRTCSWRECHPRIACTGKHCGQGTYVHDDFDVVCLSRDLVEKPPIELWPRVVRRVQVPADVEEQLIQPLEPI